MKVIKISDEGYAQVCKVASEQQTYLSDALDKIIFGLVDPSQQDKEAADAAFLEELFGESREKPAEN